MLGVCLWKIVFYGKNSLCKEKTGVAVCKMGHEFAHALAESWRTTYECRKPYHN